MGTALERLSNSAIPNVVDAILKTAQTAQTGDGKIFVPGLAKVIRIRTGEAGEGASDIERCFAVRAIKGDGAGRVSLAFGRDSWARWSVSRMVC